jgi:hypothetical protein
VLDAELIPCLQSVLDGDRVKRRDISGMRFGRLTAISRLHTDKGGHSVWLCHCDCGNETEARYGDLRYGRKASCGCLKGIHSRTHGLSKTHPLYRIWCDMRHRCMSPGDSGYHKYGARGITVCERWMKFENFISDMGDRPEGMQIERKDNNGPYSPENCIWATRAQQARNKRSTILITFNGETLCLLDWCKKLGLKYETIRQRIKRGRWSPLQALGLEPRQTLPAYTVLVSKCCDVIVEAR